LKRKETKTETVEAPKVEFSDLSELNKSDYFKDHVEDVLKKQFDYTQFELTRDDQSNYFGVEFDIQTTSARLKGMYCREPWVFATADRIARNASTVPLKIVDIETEDFLESHPANKLINGNSSFQDSITKNWVEYLDLVLTGNSFDILDETLNYNIAMPSELITLKAKSQASFQEVMESGPIDYAQIYGYGLDNVALKVPFQRVIHFKMPNPYNPFYGMSPFSAASRTILLDRYKNEFEMAFYHRGATHSGVIENEQELTREKMKRLIASFENLYTGKRNWWRPMWLPKGAKWKQSSLTMSEMQHLEGLRENRLTLLAILGVPPSQVGIVQDVNRSTSEEQTKIFWQNTIIPLVQFKCSGYNNSHLFKNFFGGSVKVVPDFAGIQAIEGSLASKGETAKLLENVYTINELRTKVLGDDPLPAGDPRGDMFVKEIQPNIFGTSISLPTSHIEEEEEEDQTIAADQVEDNLEDISGGMNEEKSIAKASILQIEQSLASKFFGYVRDYEVMIWSQTLSALEDERSVSAYLAIKKAERLDEFILKGLPILLDALDRGFTMSLLSTKRIQRYRTKVKVTREFTPQDEQAIEVIKERTRDGKRKTLIDRGIQNFYGWDETYSEHVMAKVQKDREDGKTMAETAQDIKAEMDKRKGETYRDQAFTIARTETLVAVSEGIKWSTDVLKQVFTEVNKVWLHVGDENINPDARQEHASFEDIGDVPSDYIYENPETGARLSYPRDPAGGAGDVINCRCSMSNVIPSTAYSRAKSILK
jgi:HK97 family phage portal protein